MTQSLQADFEEFISFLWITMKERFGHRHEGFDARVREWMSGLKLEKPPETPRPETAEKPEKAPKKGDKKK
jgi:hypothetical protein